MNNQRKRSESASVQSYRNRDVAPLFASKESRFAYIWTLGKVLQMSYYYMKDLQMCAYCPDSRHVAYFIIHVSD